jgi:hypothetical protein
MTRAMRGSTLFLLVAAAVWHLPALAQSKTSPTIKPPVRTEVLFGMCSLQPSWDVAATKPVPVTEGPCEDYQRYTSAGPSASYSCGGYTVLFGSAGNLKPYLDRIHLLAEWGDDTLTQSQCAKAKLTAVGWGVRCLDNACARKGATAWEKIGGPTQRSGSWNASSNTCYLEVSFWSTGKKFTALLIDTLATLEEGGEPVPKNAKGTITASRYNGTCVSLPETLPMKTAPSK